MSTRAWSHAIAMVAGGVTVVLIGHCDSLRLRRPIDEENDRETTALQLNEHHDSNSNSSSEKTIGTNGLSGVVLDGVTSKPLKFATVTVQGRTRRQLSVDEDGRFSVMGLPDGVYRIDVRRPGYVRSQIDRASSDRVKLANGNTVQGLKYRLRLGETLDGLVTDSSGEGIPGATVKLSQYATESSSRRLMSVVEPATTDSEGRYKLYGIPNGRFYLSATVSGTAAVVGSRMLVETFVGRALEPMASETILVPTPRRQHVTIVMESKPIVRLSGRVTYEGTPRRALVRLVEVGHTSNTIIGEADSEGWFAFNVPDVPREYVIAASPLAGPANLSGSERWFGKVGFTMGSHPVDQPVDVIVHRGATITGRVTTRTRRPLPSMRVFARPIDFDGGVVGSLSVAVEKDGTFRLQNVFEASTLEVAFDEDDWSIEQVLRDGHDITKGFGLASAEQINDVVIEIAKR